jgi:HlyD family secretion protein
LPEGFAGGNGRLEANQVFVSTKYPGRIAEILFDEGDTLEAGQVVARMDTTALDAQLREAQAQIVAAEGNVKAAEGNVKSAQDNRKVALAQVAAKQAEYTYASRQYERSRELVPRGAVSTREAELDLSTMATTNAQLAGAEAEATKTISAIDAAKATADAAKATTDAARATADRLRAEIADSVLKSPIRARVESRLAEPGEVLAQGGRVFSIVDLSDVYMYIYLPEA